MRLLAGCMLGRVVAAAITIGAIAAPAAGAQRPTIPIRQLAPAEARTTEAFGETAAGVLLSTFSGNLRELTTGFVLVHDQPGRRVLVFDTTLSLKRVVIDSVSGLANSYPRFSAGFVNYRGDTTLFIDPDAGGLVVIDPKGQLGNVVAPPSTRDLTFMRNGVADAQGRIMYRGIAPRPVAIGAPPTGGRGGGGGGASGGPGAAVGGPVTQADSLPIVRADLDARRIDTVGRTKQATSTGIGSIDRNPTTGAMTARVTVNPVPPISDEWAAFPDGTIAILRAADYHVDWIDPDGSLRQSPRMPYDWVRLSDEDKQAKVDSARRVIDSLTEAGSSPYRMSMMAAGSSTPTQIVPIITYADLKDIPDYIPPFRAGALKADEDGNLWILPTMSASARGGLLYDVVNRNGELVERVQLPGDRVVVGFGKDGVVYLAYRNADAKTWVIERTKVLRD